jgi:predicted nuclease with TOPRIM domain
MALREKDKLLHEKDDKIDELLKKVDRILAKNKKMSNTLKTVKDQSQKIHEQNSVLQEQSQKIQEQNTVLQEQNQEILQQNDELSHKLDSVLEDRVVKTEATGDRHTFVVLKDPTEPDMPYYAIRTKKKIRNATVKRYTSLHENASVVLEIDYNPNSVNLWDRIKTTLKGKLRCKINAFGFKGGFTERDFINSVNEINKEKFEVE